MNSCHCVLMRLMPCHSPYCSSRCNNSRSVPGKGRRSGEFSIFTMQLNTNSLRFGVALCEPLGPLRTGASWSGVAERSLSQRHPKPANYSCRVPIGPIVVQSSTPSSHSDCPFGRCTSPLCPTFHGPPAGDSKSPATPSLRPFSGGV